jgi:5'(3')-deoxyribonucleotidase
MGIMSGFRRLVIAIDCDDVLVPTAHDLIDHYNKTYGTSIDETDYYVDSEATNKRFGVDSLNVAIQRFNKRLMMPEHQNIAPYPDAVDSVNRLAQKHELHLVTGRQDFMEPVTQSMLDVYFPGCFGTVEHTNYITANQKAVRRSKGEVCLELGADIMVDDHIDHIRTVIDAGIPHGILFGSFDWGNRGKLPRNTSRCIDWLTVEKEVARLATA